MSLYAIHREKVCMQPEKMLFIVAVQWHVFVLGSNYNGCVIPLMSRLSTACDASCTILLRMVGACILVYVGVVCSAGVCIVRSIPMYTYVHVWVCRCVCMYVVHVGVWVCGCVGVWVCGCVHACPVCVNSCTYCVSFLCEAIWIVAVQRWLAVDTFAHRYGLCCGRPLVHNELTGHNSH